MKTYKANELIFALNEPDGEYFTTCTVVMTPKDYWLKERVLADFLGGHNVDNDALEEAGVSPCEIMESVWEFYEETDVEKAHQMLLYAGFDFDPDFDEWFKSQSEDSGDF